MNPSAVETKPPANKHMRFYYVNPKTRDLIVWDSETQELDILEGIKNVRVFGVKGGMIGQDYRGEGDEIGKPQNDGEKSEIIFTRKPGGRKCGKCGQAGHRRETCTEA